MKVLKSFSGNLITKRLFLSKRYSSQVNNKGEFEAQLSESIKENIKNFSALLYWLEDAERSKEVKSNLENLRIINQLKLRINEEKSKEEDLLNFLKKNNSDLGLILYQVDSSLKELPEELPTVISYTNLTSFWFRNLIILTTALITFILVTYLSKKYLYEQ